MSTLVFCSVDSQQLEYLNKDKLFTSFNTGEYYLYQCTTNHYGDNDCDITVKDTTGNKLVINISDLHNFIRVFDNINTGSILSTSFLKELTTTNKDNIRGKNTK